MSDYSHADLSAAIDKARTPLGHPPYKRAVERNAHLDTLAAILNLHKPWTPPYPIPHVIVCDVCTVEPGQASGYPCASVRVVVDALTRMGAL